jgi:hypothetical protein
MSAAPSTLKSVRRVEFRGRRGQAGQGITEFELLIALGALLVIVAMLFFAGKVDDLVRDSGESTSHRVFQPPVAQCDGSYQGVCIPPAPPDLDCGDLSDMGIPVPVTVVGGTDPHGLDPDGDGLGC